MSSLSGTCSRFLFGREEGYKKEAKDLQKKECKKLQIQKVDYLQTFQLGSVCFLAYVPVGSTCRLKTGILFSRGTEIMSL
jgi:hypothetical protein